LGGKIKNFTKGKRKNKGDERMRQQNSLRIKVRCIVIKIWSILRKSFFLFALLSSSMAIFGEIK